MRKRFLKAIDPYARRVGLYSAYSLSEAEYIGKAANVGVKKKLQENGYEHPPTVVGIPLEAAKEHPETGEVHDFSLRKIDPENPTRQYHVHGWKRSKWVELYSHLEYRPDFRRLDGEDFAEMIGRLQIHFRPEWGETYIQGKADETLQELVR